MRKIESWIHALDSWILYFLSFSVLFLLAINGSGETFLIRPFVTLIKGREGHKFLKLSSEKKGKED